jgi:hypothetical protein
VLPLEDRVAPSVSLATHFVGLGVNDTVDGETPPDPSAAVGPSSVVEAVNNDVAIYSKIGGGQLYNADFDHFFQSVKTGAAFFSNPAVAYDELTGTFFVGVLDLHLNTFVQYFTSASFDYAVSTTSNPAGAADFTYYSVNLTTGDPAGANAFWADFPRVGWNANALVVSFNMFTADAAQAYNHALILNINPQGPATTTLLDVPGGVSNATLVPAVMHGAAATDPMYFLEETLDASGTPTGNSLRVFTETNPLGSPKLTSADVSVAAYTAPPAATQKGTSDKMSTNDSGILNAEWRGNVLVAAQNVGVAADSNCHARWYQLNTAGASPALVQQGTVGVGSGADSYYPSIALAPGGTLGLTYMESSSTEYLSMYVTGRVPDDPAGQVQAAVLAKAGEAPYTANPDDDTPPYRAGDYSAVTVDSDGSFWAVNEYASSQDFMGTGLNWGTALANFQVTPNAPPQLAQAPQVNGDSAALAGAQRSMVDSIVYTFSHAVSPAANAFTIALHPGVTVNGVTGQTFGTLPTLTWASPDGGLTWVVTFSGPSVIGGSIADGVYDLILNHAAVTDSAGNTLAADRVDTFFRLYGDTNGDGTVNNADTFKLRATFGLSAGAAGYLAYLDYNGDGTVNNADVFQFRNRFGTTFGGFTATI